MANMIPISTVTVGSGGASAIEFSAIPQTYTDLIVVSSTRASAGSDTVGLQFNADTGSNYTFRRLRSDGSTATSSTSTGVHTFGGTQPESTFTANTFSNCAWYIPNYAGSTNKSVSADAVSENNATSAQAQLTASLWSNTSPITSIKIIPGSGNFVQYSTATLYGIRKY